MNKIQKDHHHMGLPAKLSAVLLIAVLLMSMLAFAQAEQTGATDDPYHFGLNEEEEPNAGKTPKPTPTEFPFEPGIREDHTGHKTHNTVLEITDYMHRIREYCDDCQMKIRVYWEDHQLDAEGHCLKCSYRCKHDNTYVREVPADGGEKTWDGNWISYPGTEITVCYRCNKYLKYENTVIRKFHNRHTRFLPEQECLPHDADTHALVRVCEDCGTEVTKYVPHNCPPSDRPYTDDVDTDTHSRLVRCDDCGFWVPQQQAHTWVHDSYMKDETLGTDTGHIEVFKCDVCGALKYEKQQHNAGRLISIWKTGDPETHRRYLQCTLCGEFYDDYVPHEMAQNSYKYDGNTVTHINVYSCTVCGQTEEKREDHSSKHVIWKSVSDTQDQETVRCNICEFTYTLAPVAHQFDTLAYESNGLDKHTVYRACSKCGEREKNGKTYTEGHTFSGATCSKCGQSAYHTGSHPTDFGYRLGYVQYDETNHATIFECIDNRCRAKFVSYVFTYQHTFDPLTMKCTECGFLREGCEHRYQQVEYYTKDGHCIGGKCVKCGKKIAEPYFENHTMRTESQSYLQSSEGGHIKTEVKKCAACEYRKTEISKESAHTFVQVGNNQHCKECGYLKKSSCAHTFEYTATPKKQSASTHYCQLKCTKCGVETFKYENHDLKVISDTGWKQTNDKVHTHTVHYQCSVCDYETTVTESEAHETSTSTRYEIEWVVPLNYHLKITETKCNKCDYVVEDVVREKHKFGQNTCMYCDLPTPK